MIPKVRIVLDSIGHDGSAPRLTTFELTLWRPLLAELNTHRLFSRNAASSRAVPIKKRLGMVISDPFTPSHWGINKSGMQASEEATGIRKCLAIGLWRLASLSAVLFAWLLMKLGFHKQIGNRLLEPFIEVTVLMTTAQKGFENFIALRANDLAEPHIQDLAYEMLRVYNESIPQTLERGEWHIPFGDQMPEDLPWENKLKIAVARAARLSYDVLDGTKNAPEKDYKLHDDLRKNGHWSSFEHVAQVPPHPQSEVPLSNLEGWVQLRKLYENECRTDKRVN